MKRNSPNTNEPFKRGDVRDDGFVFFAYTKIVKSDGFFKEIWLNPEASEKVRAKDRTNKKAKYQRKSDRKGPGASTAPQHVQFAINAIRRLHEENLEYGDVGIEEAAESLVEHNLTFEEWDQAIAAAGKVSFDVKEAVRLAVTA